MIVNDDGNSHIRIRTDLPTSIVVQMLSTGEILVTVTEATERLAQVQLIGTEIVFHNEDCLK